MYIQDLPDHIRDDWGAWSTLWKTIIVTSYLRDYRRYVLIKKEIRIFDKEATDPAKVYGWKEVLQVNVEDKSFSSMSGCIRNY
jgi:hypothetical protein